MRIFPVSIKENEPDLTLKYCVIFGSTDACYTDNEVRANMIKRALENWQTTQDYKNWYKQNIQPIVNKENVAKFNIRIS